MFAFRVIVDEPTKLGYSGFVIGALADYFMRKEYDKELEKFKRDEVFGMVELPRKIKQPIYIWSLKFKIIF